MSILESQVNYSHASAVDELITFVMVAENVPAGARVSFFSNSPTAAGQMIGGDWVVVPPGGGGSINPDFEAGQTVMVNPGYKTVFTYRTDFAGLPVPDNFRMHLRALKVVMSDSVDAGSASVVVTTS